MALDDLRKLLKLATADTLAPSPVEEPVVTQVECEEAVIPAVETQPLIDLNPDLLYATERIQAGVPLLFVTGRAGTGKSTFVRHLLQTETRNVAVVAPTGVAALNSKGQTIHSFFRFKPQGPVHQYVTEIKDAKLYRNLDLLIIDEVSMVRADLLDAISDFLSLNGKEPGVPFGGTQVVMVGDPFQLPPIVSRGADLQAFIDAGYRSPYFFDAHCVKDLSLEVVELGKVYRQEDPHFIHLLECIRDGEEFEDALEEINKRCGTVSGTAFITLTTTRAAADAINRKKLAELKGRRLKYVARVAGELTDDLSLPTELELAVGAQVMFTQNNHPRWVNGTLGIVKDLSEDAVTVEVEKDGALFAYEVKRTSWESIGHYYDEGIAQVRSRTVGTFTQFPLMLAWAITIHKSQGKTLGRIVVDLGKGAFAPGQVYVALSRCRRIEDISLARPIEWREIGADPVIKEFWYQYR